MTSINIPRDDAATVVETRTVNPRTVKEVSAYPTTPTVTSHEDVLRAPPRPTRKQKQRRRKERRKAQQQVMLDTRSGHDRRNAARDSGMEVEGDDMSTSQGIDVYS